MEYMLSVVYLKYGKVNVGFVWDKMIQDKVDSWYSGV